MSKKNNSILNFIAYVTFSLFPRLLKLEISRHVVHLNVPSINWKVGIVLHKIRGAHTRRVLDY